MKLGPLTRGTSACIIVYSIDNPNSYKDIEKFKTNFLNELKPEDRETFPFVIVGNKIDLNKEVMEQHLEKANFVSSALKNWNVERAFHEAAKKA